MAETNIHSVVANAIGFHPVVFKSETDMVVPTKNRVTTSKCLEIETKDVVRVSGSRLALCIKIATINNNIKSGNFIF